MQQPEIRQFMNRQQFHQSLKKFQHLKAGGGPFESKSGGSTEKSSFFDGFPEVLSAFIDSAGNTDTHWTKGIASPAKHTGENSFIEYCRGADFSLYIFFKQDDATPGTHTFGNILAVCGTQRLAAAAPHA